MKSLTVHCSLSVRLTTPLFPKKAISLHLLRVRFGGQQVQREGDRIINQEGEQQQKNILRRYFPQRGKKLQGEYHKVPWSPASLTGHRHNLLKGCLKKLILQELANLATERYSHVLDI